MRNSTVALGTLLLGLVAVPTASFAGWADRVSGGDAPVVSTQRLGSVPPLNGGYRLPTRAEKVQGMAPYQAFSNSPYATETARPAPAPVIDSPANDPVYFNQAMGTNRY